MSVATRRWVWYSKTSEQGFFTGRLARLKIENAAGFEMNDLSTTSHQRDEVRDPFVGHVFFHRGADQGKPGSALNPSALASPIERGEVVMRFFLMVRKVRVNSQNGTETWQQEIHDRVLKRVLEQVGEWLFNLVR
ncbi:MAG: hypothetical protein CM1200mP9_10040 [Gammaproteobacteria bacterium]|nr:MAG: hypothetical protein CM1200mP9_10040 [Gammaproteobacteria bacterium]